MLELSAQIRPTAKVGRAMVGVFLDGNLLGVLPVEHKHAAELVDLLNAATELRAIAGRAREDCCTCWREPPQGKPCLSCKARHVVAKAKGAT